MMQGENKKVNLGTSTSLHAHEPTPDSSFVTPSVTSVQRHYKIYLTPISTLCV
ncbi:hypothetical protein EI77_00605 [Prosthecobacter fusiformis]|uniref:Uncharacterized protein n=1 Tax=Prosthecobacter fusiformis TaxID=48464 RepID=A0A4R7SPZ7_9BACT|nr:hypothetical protein EI77_00605 [Prosthecobacter fusiformis]